MPVDRWQVESDKTEQLRSEEAAGDDNINIYRQMYDAQNALTVCVFHGCSFFFHMSTISMFQERLSDLIGPYWDTYGIVYTVLQPLLVDTDTC